MKLKLMLILIIIITVAMLGIVSQPYGYGYATNSLIGDGGMVTKMPGDDNDDDDEEEDDDDDESLPQGSEDAYIEEARKLVANELFEEAVPLYQKSIQMNPDNDTAYSELGDVYRCMEQYDNALVVYKKAIHNNKSNYKAFEGLAWIYMTSNRFKNFRKALRYAKQANVLSQSSDCYTLDCIAEAYFLNGYNAAAIEAGRKAVNLCPQDEIFKTHLKKYEKKLRTG